MAQGRAQSPQVDGVAQFTAALVAVAEIGLDYAVIQAKGRGHGLGVGGVGRRAQFDDPGPGIAKNQVGHAAAMRPQHHLGLVEKGHLIGKAIMLGMHDREAVLLQQGAQVVILDPGAETGPA
jgi:hypothetical protein